MPRMNGYELVSKIKALQPKVKVILMSAFEIKEEEFSRVLPSIEVGGLISKPISMKSLVKYIENITK
jgi:YesN/AraC family two-component response regulator